MLAAQGIATGDIDIAVAGGMESMSNAPYLLPRVREGLRMGDGTVVDSVIHDGLWCAFENCHMGVSGEVVADKYNVRRDEQDQYAAESHRRAAHATREGWFKDEILPISLPQRKGDPLIMDRDEPIREDTTVEALAKLKPAFKIDGTVTAGNSSQMSDGAAAQIITSREFAEANGLPILGVLRSYQVVGVAPDIMGVGPRYAIPKALDAAGLKTSDIDVFEINEAFASQALYCVRELGLDAAKVNPNGGAIALGHPLGCTGARLTASLLYELKRRNARYGVVSMCIGGGMGAAAVFERV